MYDNKRVNITEQTSTIVKSTAPLRLDRAPVPAKNTVSSIISVGNLPLQGTKAFVRIAIFLSLGESIILQPVTPTALQPMPIHIVRDCLPQLPHLQKGLSRLNAILGKKPQSSKSVNSGKNIAIGGSITEVIQHTTRTTPKQTKSQIILGTFILSIKLYKSSSPFANRSLKSCEG